MMNKNSALNIPCTHCDQPAIPGTNPPVCEDHKELVKKGSKEASNLKELDNCLKETNDTIGV